MPPHFFASRPLLPPRRPGSAPGTGPAERSVRKSAPGTDGRSAACGGYAAGRSSPQEIRPATADRPRLSVSSPYRHPNPESSARRRTARPGRHPGIHARRQSGRTAPHPAQHPRQFRPGRRGRSGRIPRTPEGALLRPARKRHDRRMRRNQLRRRRNHRKDQLGHRPSRLAGPVAGDPAARIPDRKARIPRRHTPHHRPDVATGPPVLRKTGVRPAGGAQGLLGRRIRPLCHGVHGTEVTAPAVIAAAAASRGSAARVRRKTSGRARPARRNPRRAPRPRAAIVRRSGSRS